MHDHPKYGDQTFQKSIENWFYNDSIATFLSADNWIITDYNRFNIKNNTATQSPGEKF